MSKRILVDATLLLVIVIACNSFTQNASAAVISGPVINPTNGNSYYLLSSMSWTESQAEAIALGGSLASINDHAENMWVFDTFATPSRMLWLGLSDTVDEGQFSWVAGDAVAYTNWADDEPNGGLVENWTAVRTQAIGPERKWIDWQDNGDFFGTPIHGVVEVVIPEPQSIKLLAFVMLASSLTGDRPWHSRVKTFQRE